MPPKNAVGDDLLLNFRSAFENLSEARVAPVPLYLMQFRITRATKNLQRLARHTLGHFRGEILHHGGFLVAAPARIDFRAHVVHELARRLNFRCHRGKSETQRLKMRDGPAELLAIQRVLRRILQRPLRHANGTRGGVRTRGLQGMRAIVKRLAFLANDGVHQGKRYLPEGFIRFVSTAAPTKPPVKGEWGYGAQFWLLDTMPGVPPGTFTTFGNKGQYVSVVPGHDLVVVRTGVDPNGIEYKQDQLVAEVLQALAK